MAEVILWMEPARQMTAIVGHERLCPTVHPDGNPCTGAGSHIGPHRYGGGPAGAPGTVSWENERGLRMLRVVV